MPIVLVRAAHDRAQRVVDPCPSWQILQTERQFQSFRQGFEGLPNRARQRETHRSMAGLPHLASNIDGTSVFCGNAQRWFDTANVLLHVLAICRREREMDVRRRRRIYAVAMSAHKMQILCLCYSELPDRHAGR